MIFNRNKDFLKEVFTGAKKLMELNAVQRVNVPMYDELSVVNFWPMMQGEAVFMQFFPSVLPKGRVPDREYFFNIMATVMPEYVRTIIQHAHEQRHSSKAEAQ